MKRIRPLLVLLVSLALACMGSTLAFADNENGARATQGDAIADANTASTWRDWGLENSTENVGRIWTDKTVQAGDITLTGAGGEKTIAKGSSTFLTALSAISSTSNLKSTAITPLDIVLVLDASGSMDDAMGRDDSTKRIVALQNAANSFIDEIAKQNAGVSDAAKQHQVSIVKFAGEKTDQIGNEKYSSGGYRYNYSQVMKSMSACTDTSKDQFKDTINGISPAGATRADYGLELAQSQSSNRSDAKKIVIFFTDGTPTKQSEFNSEVASNAVSAAKAIKDAKGSVYTIGIFGGADPSAEATANGTSRENKFMQAASSNYPDATYVNNRGGYSWNFGDRAADSDFYKAATNADDLKKVFDDISKEIVKGAGYPTDVQEGFEADSGFITFTDQLGDYMQVDGFTSIVFANQVFENPVKTTNGLVDAYTFSGEAGNALYPKGNLSDIDITVTRSADLKTGDKVEVKVPAALIPLRNFQINEDGTGSVGLTFPIRAFYGSSLKADVAESLANPDSNLAAYIESNSSDGKVNFFANKWNGGTDGDVVANFTPSKGNSYYYITEDTPIYQDEACTQRATAPLQQDETYYYQRIWYDIDNGKATQQTKTVSFDSSVVENVNDYISSDSSGKAYFKAGTPRMTYIDELNTPKSENVTKTASTFINPNWAGEQVNTLLGNNGKLSVSQPGTLAVSKTLEVPDGYNVSDFANDSFEFTLNVPNAKSATLKAQVKNAAGENVGNEFDITFDENGNATHSLKHGETLHIYGLSSGSAYTVTETLKAGFTQTSPADKASATGTTEAGKTSNADFTNKYEASGVLDGATSLAGGKVLNGRAWQTSDKFTFVLRDANTSVDAPMPDDGVVTKEVHQPEGAPADTLVGFNFGDITYTKPGVYTYEIFESEELSTINPGVSASQALYRVTVKVTDESHNGQLSVESVMEKLAGDDGKLLDQPEKVEWNGNVPPVAAFTNSFNNDYVDWTPSGIKTYTDSTGANQMVSGMFHVVAATQDSAAPMPGSQIETDVEGWRYVVTSVSDSGSIVFDPARFSLSDVGEEYKYVIAEAVQVNGKWTSVRQGITADADGNYILNGMKYDATSWDATVKVGSAKVDGKDAVTLEVKYENRITHEVTTAPQFTFTNSYNPNPATAAVDGTKTLTGRDMADGETFGFTLSAADKATQDAVTSGTVTIPTSTATVSDATNGEAKGFSFGDITFTKPGAYKFNVNETQWDGNALPDDGTNGLTFDRSTKTVTVVVTDGHDGSLKTELAYPEGGVAFTNKFESTIYFDGSPGLTVEKVLNGRNMNAGEFSFSIKGVDSDTPGAVTAAEADARLSDSDRTFVNDARLDGVANSMQKMTGVAFTQDDIGKVFCYEVRENVPADEAKLAGVIYDDAAHVFEIKVIEDGGQLIALTKSDLDPDEDFADASVLIRFTNAYRAEDVGFDTVNAQLKKILEGRDWLDSDSFIFNLKALTDGAPMPEGATDGVATATVTKANAKNFGFGTIKFTSDDLNGASSKTFEYEVSEVSGAIPGIDYATNKAVIKVTVADNGTGQLTTSATTENGTFVNRYSAEISYTAAGGLNVAKTLNGRDMTDGQFEIKVTPADEASADALNLPMGGKSVSVPASADGVQIAKQVLDGDVVFRQNDVGKTYTYKVAEQGTAPGGYTYDTAERTVTITVADNPAEAALVVTTTVSGGPEGTKTFTYGSDETAVATVPFVNSYKASGDLAQAIVGTKALSGRDLTAGEFTFAVKYAAGGSDLLTAQNAADGSITFGTLSYDTETLAQLVKDGKATKNSDGSWTVGYVAYEKTDGLAAAGVTAQTQPIAFTVTVVDNGDGTLTATPNMGNGLKFENEYKADSASIGLSGVKVLKHEQGLEPADIAGKFTFTVTGEDGAPMPERTKVTNDATGKVDFGDITFTFDAFNEAWEKAYPVTQSAVVESSENVPTAEKAAVESDAAANAQGIETDNAKTAEKADASASKASAEAAEQSESDESAVSEQKSDAAEGKGAIAASEASTQEQPAKAASAAKTAATDSASAKTAATDGVATKAAAQSSDSATQAGAPRSLEFTYEITESGSASGVTNDLSATKTVRFKVTDDGNGKLTVERVAPAGDSAPAFTFTNTYSVKPVNSSVTDQLAVTKQLTGRDLVSGEFQFKLLEGGTVVAAGTNSAAGAVTLDAITYDKPGTHHYTLIEVGGGIQSEGVTYDGTAFGITTTVADNDDGTLSVTHKFDGGANEAVFNNAYASTGTSVTLGATKVLTGKKLEANEFTFALTGEDGSKITAKNDANGSVTFPAIEYTKEGTYHYNLSEEKGTEAGVTYDETAYPVVVTVADSGQGSLEATVSYDADKVPVFRNSYQKPENPVSVIFNNTNNTTVNNGAHSTTVKTGDSLLPMAVVIAAAAALAAGIAAAAHRRGRGRKE